MILVAGVLLGLLGMGHALYALVHGGRSQEGVGLGPISERAIHAVAGIGLLIGGAVAIFLVVVTMPASLAG